MRFAHLADTHLGFRQYGLHERELDFYHAFEQIVMRIVEERPDFVIHSGDLFDFPRPQPRALWVASRCFSKLKEKGIPVYAITGNHDMIMQRGAMPPHVLFGELGMRMITEDEPFFVHRGVFIGGTPYTSKYFSPRLIETMSILSKSAAKHKKSVLVMHQGIDRFLPQMHEIRLEDIPKNFDYYAFGHVHSRIQHPFGKGRLAYAGSTELWSLNEYDDYRKNGKGFFMVDLDGDEPDVQPVDIQLSREIIKQRLHADSLDESLSRLRSMISGMGSKPLAFLEVDSGGYDRKTLHDKLLEQLSELVLSLRVSYKAEADLEAERVLTRTFDIPEMIRRSVKDSKKANLAIQLFRALSSGEDDEALRIAEDFYGGAR
ncbi:MAG: DNA repair exonuclease [Candidatus Aenigmarchaeota archaeon]|nr:DNA repair exonuclease [Candidatus Aenigmarchaeota archaeon]